ncbi:MAG: hypothetical protein ACM3VX_05635 [Bacteroidota bacterium]
MRLWPGSRPPEEGETWEQKVLRSFFASDGQLIEIPAQRKKRDVLLRPRCGGSSS